LRHPQAPYPRHVRSYQGDSHQSIQVAPSGSKTSSSPDERTREINVTTNGAGPELLSPNKNRNNRRTKLELATTFKTPPIQFYTAPPSYANVPRPHGPPTALEPSEGGPPMREEPRKAAIPGPPRTASNKHGVFPMLTRWDTFARDCPQRASSAGRVT